MQKRGKTVRRIRNAANISIRTLVAATFGTTIGSPRDRRCRGLEVLLLPFDQNGFE